MNKSEVDIVEQKIVYQGYFRIEQYKVRFKLFNGGWSKIVQREVFERGKAVGVLLYDPDLDKVVLIEQFRIGAMEDPQSPWLIELVAGIIDADDASPEAVAKRETKEESGLKINGLTPICQYWVSPGGTTEQVQIYCARVDARLAGGIHGLQDEGEDIKVHVWEADKAIQGVKDGRIRNASAIIALQWLALNKDEIVRAMA